MLPADQRADFTGGGLRRAQAGPVAGAPDEALGEGRAQLAVMVAQRAVGVEGEQCVVERVAAALVDAHHQHDAGLARLPRQGLRLRAGHGQAVGVEFGEDGFGAGVIPERGAGADVQPGGIAGQPGLAEGDELRASAGGFRS